MGLTYRCTFPAGVVGTWMAKSPRGDDPLVRRSPRQPMGHPLGSGHPLEFAVRPQRSLDRGYDPRCFTDAHALSLEKLEHLRDPRSFVGALAPSPERFEHPRPHACG
jgi:hypothetical protein